MKLIRISAQPKFGFSNIKHSRQSQKEFTHHRVVARLRKNKKLMPLLESRSS